MSSHHCDCIVFTMFLSVQVMSLSSVMHSVNPFIYSFMRSGTTLWILLLDLSPMLKLVNERCKITWENHIPCAMRWKSWTGLIVNGHSPHVMTLKSLPSVWIYFPCLKGVNVFKYDFLHQSNSWQQNNISCLLSFWILQDMFSDKVHWPHLSSLF